MIFARRPQFTERDHVVCSGFSKRKHVCADNNAADARKLLEVNIDTDKTTTRNNGNNNGAIQPKIVTFMEREKKRYSFMYR